MKCKQIWQYSHPQSITGYFACGLIMFQSATGKNTQHYDPFSRMNDTNCLSELISLQMINENVVNGTIRTINIHPLSSNLSLNSYNGACVITFIFHLHCWNVSQESSWPRADAQTLNGCEQQNVWYFHSQQHCDEAALWWGDEAPSPEIINSALSNQAFLVQKYCIPNVITQCFHFPLPPSWACFQLSAVFLFHQCR